MAQRIELPITGMTCVNCSRTIERSLKRTAGVDEAQVSYAADKADVAYDPAVTSPVQLVEQVFAVAGLDFQFGQALVDVVGRCHPGRESLNQIGLQGLMGKR